MKLKILPLTAALWLLCLLGGCTAVEVSERMYVQMMGVSEEEGDCLLCVQTVGTHSAPDEAPVYEYHEGRGANFRQAAADIEAENGRQLFFGHCTLLILDEDHLTSAERLKMFMGERISPGCRVCFSNDPGEVLSKEADGSLIGADVISGETKRLEDRGQFKEVTLKEVCENAARGTPFLLPAALPGTEMPLMSAAGGTVTGSVVCGGGTVFLDMDETVIAGLIAGETGAEIPVGECTLRVDSVKPAVYYQTGEKILNISLNISGTMTEITDNTDLSLCGSEAGELLTAAISDLFAREDGDRIIEAAAGVTVDRDALLNCHVSAQAEIKG